MGRMQDKLTRSVKEIKNDRGNEIIEIGELTLRRMIEDRDLAIKQLKREKEGMLDISPSSTTSLFFPDFDAVTFSQRQLQLAIDIEVGELELKIAHELYDDLYGSNKK